MAKLKLNDRQMQAIAYLKINGVITNADLQKLVGSPQRTATRDLNDLNQKGVVELRGKGRGASYRLVRKRAMNTPNAPRKGSLRVREKKGKAQEARSRAPKRNGTYETGQNASGISVADKEG